MSGQKSKVQKWKLDIAAKTATVTYPIIGKSIVIRYGEFAEKVQARLLAHGVKQRCGDLESNDKTGSRKFAKLTEYLNHLQNGGDYRMSGERDDTELVIEAVNRAYPKFSIADLKKAAEFDEDQVDEWKEDLNVKAAIQAIRAERAKKRAEESSGESKLTVKFK